MNPQHHEWTERGVQLEPERYRELGVNDPEVARNWEIAGFGPGLIEGFIKRGISATEALELVRRGYIDSDNPQRPPPLMGQPWRTVFTRARGQDRFGLTRSASSDESARHRVRYAALNLEVETVERGGGLFNTLVTVLSFPGGRVELVDGYGWGSHSGVWVYRTAALRLLCRRMALTPPRRFPGELLPDLDALEAEAVGTRTAHRTAR